MGQRHQIELTPENWECLQDLAQKFEPKTSITAHANSAVSVYVGRIQLAPKSDFITKRAIVNSLVGTPKPYSEVQLKKHWASKKVKK